MNHKGDKMVNSIELTPQQKDEYLNNLLLFMKDELENQGISNYKQLQFHFQPNGDDRMEFVEQCKLSDDEFDVILKFAFTHKFINSLFMGDPMKSAIITEDGMARAVSVERAQYKTAVTDNSSSITFNGPVKATNFQAGNNNVQNITSTFEYLVNEIKNSEASEDEKTTAIQKLKDFVNNSVVSGILSGCGVEIIKILVGLGI